MMMTKRSLLNVIWDLMERGRVSGGGGDERARSN